MSSDKRSSKLFGSRISSIFTHSSSSDHLNPPKSAGLRSDTRSIKSKTSANSLKPKQHLATRERSTSSLDSASFVFDQSTNHQGPANAQSQASPGQPHSQSRSTVPHHSQSSAATHLHPQSSTISHQQPVGGAPASSPTTQNLVPVTPKKSPARRKPPPGLLDEPGFDLHKELAELPSLAHLNQLPPTEYSKPTTDIDDIIGTLESEIGNLVNKSDIEETSPLPDPQNFLFQSPTKSIYYQSDMQPSALSPRADSDSAHSDDLVSASSMGLPQSDGAESPIPAGLPRSDGSNALSDFIDPIASYKGSSSNSFNVAPYPIDSPVERSSINTPVNLEITHSSRVSANYSESSFTSSSVLASPTTSTGPTVSNSYQTNPIPTTSTSSVYSESKSEPNTAFGSTQSLNIANTTNKKPQGSAIYTMNSNGSINSRTVPLMRSATSGTSIAVPTPAPPLSRPPFKPLESTSTSDSLGRPMSRPPSLNHNQSSLNHHRKSSSISSLFSSNSAKNVNLSQLKKTLNLRPGEGERSNYVLSVRRNAGTAFNEAGPGKWKLPTGIQPLDKSSASYTGSNGRYMRLAGSHMNRSKKVSGVELKHGHLARRLLAAEVNDNDDMISRSKIQLTPKESLASNDLSSVSRGNSLDGTTTFGSVATGTDSQSGATTGKESSSSSSSGSISDENVEIGGYYQHPGYRFDDNENDDDNETKELSSPTTATNSHVDNAFPELKPNNNGLDDDDYDDYDDKPRLVLANPDNDSDSN